MMFDPVLLRTFVAIAETANLTRAAGQLGISQPTVSQRLRRLEDAARAILVVRDSHSLALTNNGEAMLSFAKDIVAAHDAAAAYFSGSAMRGRVRLGSADDLALTELPPILREFRRVHPQVNLELTVGQSPALARRLRAGALDLAFVKQEPGLPDGRLVRRDRYIWVAHASTVVADGAPVPLITYPSPSHSREAALHALADAGREWRVSCNVRDMNGALAAVRAGIGVAVLPQGMVPDDLVPAGNTFNLPLLGEVDFTVLANPRAAGGPMEALLDAIVRRAGAVRPRG